MAFKKRYIGALLTCGLCFSGCETPPPPTLNIAMPMASLRPKREIPPALAQIFQFLKEEKYKEASQLINLSLQSQPKSVALHVLNALTYEKLAETGEARGLELAAIGYQNAINLDGSNLFAITQLAKLKFQGKKFDDAQELFANALLVKPNDPTLLHELAAASYYAYDIKTAVAIIDRAAKINPDDPLIHRSAAMIHAAVGDFPSAKKHFALFQKKAGQDSGVKHVQARLADWSAFYQSGRLGTPFTNPTPSPTSSVLSPSNSSSDSSSNLTSGSTTVSSQTSGSGGTPSGSTGTSNSSAFPTQGTNEPQASSMGGGGIEGSQGMGAPPSLSQQEDQGPQIIIDCYLLRVEEVSGASIGNNILQSLAITLNPGGFTSFSGRFGGTGSRTGLGTGSTPTNVSLAPATGFKPNQTVAPNTGAASAYNPPATTVNFINKGTIAGSIFSAGLTWAGLTYSLNIAEAYDTRVEVISRPSILTFLKKQAIFFSGQELVQGLAGQYGATVTQYPVGVTIAVTPESLEGDLLTVNIKVEQSNLDSPNPNLQTTVVADKTSIDTFVKMHLGETLMLGGIYQRTESVVNNGVPGLRRVPVAKYFFSNESSACSRNSIVFMMTPRSPDLVKSAINRAMARGNPPHLSELSLRNPSWFATHPNLVPVFTYIARDPVVYYEFRSGDVLPPSWGWEPSMSQKLDQITQLVRY